jgi:hypothetical protein
MPCDADVKQSLLYVQECWVLAACLLRVTGLDGRVVLWQQWSNS